MQIDLPEDAIAVSSDLELECPEGVISVGIVVLSEDIEALDALHDDRLGRRGQVRHTACHHDLTRDGEIRAPCPPKPVILLSYLGRQSGFFLSLV